MQWAYSAIVVVGGLLSTGITYGILVGKIERLRDEAEEMKKEIAQIAQLYVSFKHFEAVIGPMQAQASEMARDIKEILGYVKK